MQPPSGLRRVASSAQQLLDLRFSFYHETYPSGIKLFGKGGGSDSISSAKARMCIYKEYRWTGIYIVYYFG